jgi:hypothetical protein
MTCGTAATCSIVRLRLGFVASPGSLTFHVKRSVAKIQ